MSKYFEKPILEKVDLKKMVEDRKANKEEKKSRIEELEVRYDKKFNGFCLAISSSSYDQLTNIANNKMHELYVAKNELKEAKDKDEKLELKIKVDYLKNVIKKCDDKLKKMKKSEENND